MGSGVPEEEEANVLEILSLRISLTAPNFFTQELLFSLKHSAKDLMALVSSEKCNLISFLI